MKKIGWLAFALALAAITLVSFYDTGQAATTNADDHCILTITDQSDQPATNTPASGPNNATIMSSEILTPGTTLGLATNTAMTRINQLANSESYDTHDGLAIATASRSGPEIASGNTHRWRDDARGDMNAAIRPEALDLRRLSARRLTHPLLA